ncbi:alpha/beta fold hydrolase [Candidatus Chloroploca sp. Khr17]|uniref:alpha/beta fold hydrolase n=1 Tax=Candidatus Chloroploca sp. Khr17 TaxID=2496869 RepID=UPI001F0E46F6|nr:alpha/beta hydrolase [Candidatus Chloroploca sp. Khr17]
MKAVPMPQNTPQHDQVFRRRLEVGGAFSRVLIPLSLGITRRALLRAGVSSHERRLAGILSHYYYAPAHHKAVTSHPLVLIHGIADNALTWAFTMRGMTKIGPVYALDLPGFGQSGYPPGRRFATIAEQVAVIQALIREVIGQPAILVGNSMGGWVAARLAELSPELTRGIVLLDPGGAQLNGRPSWEHFVATVSVPDLATVRRIYRQMFGRVPLALYLGQASFRDLFARDAVRQFIEAASEDDFFTPEDLRSITVPTMLIWGDRDRFLPAGSFEFFRDNMPQAELHVIKGSGHLPQREQPRRLVRLVRGFALKQSVPASGR